MITLKKISADFSNPLQNLNDNFVTVNQFINSTVGMWNALALRGGDLVLKEIKPINATLLNRDFSKQMNNRFGLIYKNVNYLVDSLNKMMYLDDSGKMTLWMPLLWSEELDFDADILNESWTNLETWMNKIIEIETINKLTT